MKTLVNKKVEIGRKLDGHYKTISNLKMNYSNSKENASKMLEKFENKPHDSSISTKIRNTLTELDKQLASPDEETVLSNAPEIPLKKEKRVVSYRKMVPLNNIKSPIIATRTASTGKRPKLFDKDYLRKLKEIKSKVGKASKEDQLNISLENIDDLEYESCYESDFASLKGKIVRMRNTLERYDFIFKDKEVINERKLRDIEDTIGINQENLENLASQNNVLTQEV